MSIQNDNTLVTKGDLKSLYTDKIAPYLGGGISYYYTDRTGEELKSIDMRLSASQAVNAGSTQNTLINFDKSSGTYETNNHKVIIPAGQRIQINVALQASPGASNAVDGEWQIYDYTNDIIISKANFTYIGSGYSWSSAKSVQYTAPENGALVGVKVTALFYNTSVTASSSFTIQEIGRIVDPVKYVDNNSDLEETPVGNIISYMGNSVPKHYLACDGQTYPIGSYPELEAFIIDEFGSINYFGGDGTTTFAVPDLQGEFLRGSGTNSHTNQGSGGAVGEHQDGTIQNSVSCNGSNAYLIGDYISNVTTDKIKADWTSATGTVYYGSANKVAQNTSFGFTSRPTNTAVKYCIKYESTYHAFFSNAAYKVSIAANVPSHSGAAIAITLDNSDIIGDANLVSGNSFIAPLDGLYLIGMNWSNNGVWDQNYMINVNGADVYHVVGIGVTDMLQLQKGDVVTIKTSKTSAQSGRASFALVTSNYNPTIVSADSVYSENEQMIGYWTDGKPLYQKVLTGNVPTTSTASLIFDNPNVYIVAIPFCSIDWSSDESKWFGEYPGQLKFYSDANNSKLYLNDQPGGGSETRHFGKPYKVVIQYTKTTDTASTLQIENSLLLNRPDLWTPGTEYHFGGGLYGKRISGTMNTAVGVPSYITIASNFSGSIFSYGGTIKRSVGGNWDFAIPCTYKNDSVIMSGGITVQLSNSVKTLSFYFTDSANMTNVPYDVWVTYKK